MSFGGGGGTQGTIRYALIVDDAQATQKLNTFKTNLNSVGASTNTLNKNMGALGNNFKNATGGLTQQNTLLGQTIKQHQTLGNTIKTNASRFAGLATGLSATASGALQLAAGFRDYNDAQIAVDRVTRRLSLGQEALGKAQVKLNDLQKKGVTSGKDYEQAQLDVTQAQQQVEIQTQLVGEAQERLFDSQTQFVASVVPTVLGAVGSLGFAFKEFGGSLGKLTASFKQGGAAAKIFSSDLAGMGIGAAAGVGAALLIIQQIQQMQSDMEAAGLKMKELDWGLLSDPSQIAQSAAQFDELIARTGASLIELKAHPTEVGKRFREMGGQLDKSGQIAVSAKERYIDLGTGIKGTSLQYIHWATNMLKANKSQQEVADWLVKTSKLAKDDAIKVMTFAILDAAKANDTLAASAEKVTDVFIEQHAVIDKGVAFTLKNYMRGWEDTMTEIIDITSGQGPIQAGENIGEGMATGLKNMESVLDTTMDATIISMLDQEAITMNAGKLGWDKLIQEHWSSYAEAAQGPIDEVMKTMNESGNKIVADQKRIAEESTKAWRDFATQFNKRDLDLAKMLGLDKKINPDEMFEDLVEDLPKSLEKRLKGALKLDLKMEATNTTVQNYITSLIDGITDAKGETFVWDANLEVDDKAATEYAQNLVDFINKKTSEEDLLADPNLKDLRDDLTEAIDNGASASEIADILAEHVEDAPPIKVVVVEDETSVKDVHTNIQSYMDKNPVDVPSTTTPVIEEPIFPGGGFDMGEGLEIPSTAAVDKIDWAGIKATSGWNEMDATINSVTPSPTMEDLEGGYAVTRVYSKDFPRPGVMPEGVETIERPENIEDGEMPPPPSDLVLKVNNTQAIKAIDVVAKRIASLSTIPAMIKLINTTAIKATDVVAKRIFSLTSLQPSISLQNKKAIKANDVVANRIDSLTKIKPSISLQNNKAIKAVDVVAKRINSLGDINPTVNVQVKYNGIRSFQHGGTFMTSGPELIMVGDNPGGRERVSVAPTSTGASAGGHGTLVVHLHNVNSDRETVRTFRREIGKEIFRFGPT